VKRSFFWSVTSVLTKGQNLSKTGSWEKKGVKTHGGQFMTGGKEESDNGGKGIKSSTYSQKIYLGKVWAPGDPRTSQNEGDAGLEISPKGKRRRWSGVFIKGKCKLYTTVLKGSNSGGKGKPAPGKNRRFWRKKAGNATGNRRGGPASIQNPPT